MNNWVIEEFYNSTRKSWSLKGGLPGTRFAVYIIHYADGDPAKFPPWYWYVDDSENTIAGGPGVSLEDCYKKMKASIYDLLQQDLRTICFLKEPKDG